MIRCLKDMLTIPNPRPVYIILDALERSVQTGPEFHRLVNKSLHSSRSSLTFIFRNFISASPADRSSIFELLSHLWRINRVSLHEESGQQQVCVDYINSVVYSDSETMMKRWREDEKKWLLRRSRRRPTECRSIVLTSCCLLMSQSRFRWCSVS